MNERQSLHHSQSAVVCRNFLGLWLLKYWKIPIATDSDVQTFLGGEENQNTKEKKPKLTYLVASVKAIPAAGNENRQLEDFPHAAFGKKLHSFL